MRAEQPAGLCTPWWRMGVKVGATWARFGPPVIVAGRPVAVLSLRFHLFYVRCCSVFKCVDFNSSVF